MFFDWGHFGWVDLRDVRCLPPNHRDPIKAAAFDGIPGGSDY